MNAKIMNSRKRGYKTLMIEFEEEEELEEIENLMEKIGIKTKKIYYRG